MLVQQAAVNLEGCKVSLHIKLIGVLNPPERIYILHQAIYL